MPIQLVEAGEIELACEEAGDGDAVILIAGGFMDMDQWAHQFDALAATHRVIRFDQRGVGKSSMPVAGYSIDQFALDTATLIEKLDAAPAVLFGSSLGGLVAIEIALNRPELVRGLILAATPAGIKGEPIPSETQMTMLRGVALPLEQAAAALQDVLFGSDYHDEHPELLESVIEKRRDYPSPPLALMGPLQSALIYDPLEKLAALECPALILLGEDDRIVPVGNAAILGDAIPNSTVVTVPDAGHALVIEAAEPVNAAVADFLATL